MLENNRYFVIQDNEYQLMSLFDLVRLQHRQEPRPTVWSARLSTGLLGYTDCKSGNKGPKNYSEVLLAVGDDGLRRLVELGFITCPVCRPEQEQGFWDAVGETVEQTYGIDSLEGFVNKEVLPFDARRVNWSVLMPIIGKAPNRLYIPKGLSKPDVLDFRRFFKNTGVVPPPIGWYDPDVKEGFTEY
jgi:hypothetical protein